MANNSKFRWPWQQKSEPVAEQQQESVKRDEYELNSCGCAYLRTVFYPEDGHSPYSTQQIVEMAKNPMRNIKQLREWARWAYYYNGTIGTAIDALTALHSLEYYPVARCKKAGDKRNVPQESFDKLHSVLRSMRYKEVIRDAIFHNANDGMYVGYMETRTIPVNKKKNLTDADIANITEINSSGINTVVVSLPIDYVRIIGRRNNCYEVAFDLKYFERFSINERKRKLQSMPHEIQTGWANYENGENKDGASWLVLDWHRTIVTKIKSNQSDPYGVPFAVAALDDIDYARYFIDTKRSILDRVNNNVYYETFPEGKEKGTSALTNQQQVLQHNTVKEALTQRRNPSGVSFFSLAAGTQMDNLDVDLSLLDEDYETSIEEDVNEDIGFSAAALNGSSSGNYATATLNLNIIANNVFSWIEAIVEELNKCLNYNVIKDKNYKIEFRVLPVTFANRDSQVSYFSDLYARGKGSLIAWIAATGINPDDYLSLMDYELEYDFENRYPVHKTSFTLSGNDLNDTDADKSGKLSTNPRTESTYSNDGNSSPSPSD